LWNGRSALARHSSRLVLRLGMGNKDGRDTTEKGPLAYREQP
jgi:hypothetical protein